MITLSLEQARHFLATYHFRATDIPGVFARLGTVQYDPLNPVGRNPDLVLQARVPGYRFDDWQAIAYQERAVYDSWDKQACLVPISDWPLRARIRAQHRPYHDRAILEAEAGVAEKIFREIDQRGPLSSLEFEDRKRMADQNSWYGLTQTKRVLRAMWACGLLLTHHRKSGRHYYDRPERVIPVQHFQAPEPGEDEYYRWILARRHQAVGLLRPGAEASVWTACGASVIRKRALQELLEMGELVAAHIGDKQHLYYLPTTALPLLDSPAPKPEMRFLAPLDSLLWDRKALQHIFGFDYIWEVYKPVEQRRWGYYVLPVFYGDRFVARVDSRLIGTNWTITRWWWEPDVTIGAEMLDALCKAASKFLHYLRADGILVEEGVEHHTRNALLVAQQPTLLPS